MEPDTRSDGIDKAVLASPVTVPRGRLLPLRLGFDELASAETSRFGLDDCGGVR